MREDSHFTKLRIDEAPLWGHRRPLLLKLDMELTERCNNNCIHCCINLPADDQEAINREMPAEEIKEILKEAASLGCLRVRLTGGEPLLREDFEELYLFARRLGLRIILFTNGTLITPHLAGLFAHIPPLEAIEITLYGMKKKSYEAVSRTPGSFEAARRGINLLLENEVTFVVKGTILPPNKDEREQFEKWASSIPWMDKPPSYAMFLDLRCRRDSEERNRLIRGLRLSPEEGLEALTRNPERYIKEMKRFCSRSTRSHGNNLFSCGSGVGSGCVDAYGHFQPCLTLRHPDTIYDLRNGSLKDAITNFSPKIREMKAKNPDYLARCASCFLRDLCEQCPSKSWMEYGTLDTPVEYLCEVAHAKARYLGLLESGEMAWEVRNWEERIRSFSEEGQHRPGKSQTEAGSRGGAVREA